MDSELERRIAALEALTEGTAALAAAHLRIRTAGRVRDIFLGSTAQPAARPPIVAWETAPLAEVFFDVREGEEYEVELDDDRVLGGQVLERNLLRFEDGQLCEVITERARCILENDGWVFHPRHRTLLPRPGDRRPRQVRLDAAQQAIVDLPPNAPVLVLGEAGAGKTTVAVHRIHRLLTERRRWRAGVVVPTRPLRHRIESMLDRLGLGGRVSVFDFDQWAGIEARKAFKDLPTQDSRHAPAGVVRIKRDPALRVAMKRLVDSWPRHKSTVGRGDLAELFSDRKLIEEMARHADPLVPLPQIDEVLLHSREQYSDGEVVRGADDEVLSGVDGRDLDADSNAGTIDPEDFPVLFALDRMRAARGGKPAAEPRRFDVLFVDEAQELAPFELELLGRAHRGALIVAGDAGQQVDPAAGFRGWDATVAALGEEGIERAELKIGYRCPPPISAFAQDILEGRPAAQSDAVRFVPHAHEAHLVAWIVEEVRALRQRDPHVTIGVIARDGARLGRLLDRAIPVVGEEELRPGATHVVSVEAAKGLEFDTVIVADATEASFPDTDASRRALYVAVTRATHQLVVSWAGAPSPLLALG